MLSYRYDDKALAKLRSQFIREMAKIYRWSPRYSGQQFDAYLSGDRGPKMHEGTMKTLSGWLR